MNEHGMTPDTSAASHGMLDLPTHCEVLVVGAGPAGSACAQVLSQAGVQTLLIDAADFPRDKTCGDGLIPDAHAAFERLGVYEEVMAQAQNIGCVRCVGPTGRHVDIPGTLAVLPRMALDHILVRAAQRAGAQLATPWRLEALLKDDSGRVSGGRFKSEHLVREVHAQHTILATGASAQALAASQVCDEPAPSGFGLRGYVSNPAMVEKIPHIELFWHPRLALGYGWIFPCGNGVFNVGVGYWPHRQRNSQIVRKKNLHTMLDDFVALHANARELMQTGTVQQAFKGAPLRVSLRGTRWSAPGLLVTGEAAGSTYHFTGEGIGKAMETGMLAAQTLIAARQHGFHDAAVAAHYTQALQQIQPKYDFYETANLVNRYPWLAELVIRKAAHSAPWRQSLSRLLQEEVAARPLTLGRVLRRLWA
jgi:menaquinone-9 beta-reductase